MPSRPNGGRESPRTSSKGSAVVFTEHHGTYGGSMLTSIAYPLSGIGTGTVSLGGLGELRDWEIFNRPGKGVQLPYTFFARLRMKNSAIARSVKGPRRSAEKRASTS